MKAFLLASYLAFATGIASAQSPRIPPQSHIATENTRYQLLAATVTGIEGDQKYVFMIDTATGRVWQFQPVVDSKDESGKQLNVLPLFIPVRVMPEPIRSNDQRR